MNIRKNSKKKIVYFEYLAGKMIGQDLNALCWFEPTNRKDDQTFDKQTNQIEQRTYI